MSLRFRSWCRASMILASLAGACAFCSNAAASGHACGGQRLSTITGYVTAQGISCAAAREVFVAVERSPLPNDVATTPYFRFSPSYSVSTPAGRVSCRREPHGLAGSEHTIFCVRGPIRVRWYTVHE
jgi:hypothetical protein